MAWTSPKTWTNEPLLASDLNTHLRDNLDALKSPPRDAYQATSDYTTTSTTFTNVDGTNMSFTITTNGGDIHVGFFGTITNGAASNENYFTCTIDGNDQSVNSQGLVGARSVDANDYNAVGFHFVATGFSAASHTINLQWRTSGNTVTLYQGAQFWVQEIS